MSDTKYLTLDEVLGIHEVMIQRYGGSFGLRDKGLLESALASPQQSMYRSTHYTPHHTTRQFVTPQLPLHKID